MFKQLTFFRAAPDFVLTSEMLAKEQARPCEPTEPRTAGFCPPRKDAPDLMTHTAGGCTLFCLEICERLLPASVVTEFAQERAAEIEENEARRVGRKEMRTIKEAIISELLPKSHQKKKHVRAILADGFLIVDTGSQTVAEELIECLHKAIGEYPFSIHKTEITPATAMTSWVAGDTPDSLTVDDFCELESPLDGKPSITYKHVSLDSNDIRERLTDGYRPRRLAITISDRVSMILTDSFQLKRFTLLDIMTEQIDGESEDAAERFDAELILFGNEAVKSINYLTGQLGGAYKDLADQGKQDEEKRPEPDSDGTDSDPLYEKAVQIVVTNQRASISLVQRHLVIGYNRAARLIEAMEKKGLVSTQGIDGCRSVCTVTVNSPS